MFRIIAALLFLNACGDIARDVNVAPSAHHQMETLAAAVDRMNELAGREEWSIRAVDREHRLDDEIIVRQEKGVRVTEDGDFVKGHTDRTHKGVIIRIADDCSERAFAHELGHAAGLSHVNDKGNLMYERANSGEWTLTEEQLDEIR